MAASLVQHGSINSIGQNGVANATASSSLGQTGKKRRRQGKSSSSGIEQTSSMTRALVNGENGLSASNNTAADEELEQQLEPTADECYKLAAVIRLLDKHGIGNEKLPEEAGVPSLLEALNPSSSSWPHAVSLLEFYLDLAVSAVKARPSHASTSKKAIINNGETSVSAIPPAPDSTSASELEADLDRFTHTIRGVFEELKDSAAARLSRKRVKRSGKPRFALHRSIGTSYDVFSSTSTTIPDDDKSWQQLADTDLLAVYPTQLAEPVSAPRLGDINGLQPLSTKRAIQLQPQIEPVSFLYYDPYQSFAPTYDSSTATLSYAQSVSLRVSRQTAQAWSNQPLPPLPPEEIAGEVRPPLDDTLASIDPSLFASTSPQDVEKIDPSDMRLYLRMMEESQVIDKRLAENIDLLRALQEAQWSRLRKSETKATDIEIQASKRLLESLTSLANSRPRTPDISPPQHGRSNPYDIGPLLSASIVQSKPKAYYGILEKGNAKGVPDYVMAKEDTDTMMKDGSASMERKNSSHGTKKSKKGSSSSKAKHAAAAQNGTSANISPAIGQADLPQTTATSAHVKQETPIV